MEDKTNGHESIRPGGVNWRPMPTNSETLRAFSRITDLRELRLEQIGLQQHADEGNSWNGFVQELLDVIAGRIKQLESLDARAIADLKAAEEAEDRAEELAEELRKRARAQAPEQLYVVIELDEDTD